MDIYSAVRPNVEILYLTENMCKINLWCPFVGMWAIYPYIVNNCNFFFRMIGCMCFYGHCQNTANLGSDIFMSYLLGATIEIPSWGVPYLIQKFGRKVSLIACFLLSGIAGIIYATLPICKLITTKRFFNGCDLPSISTPPPRYYYKYFSSFI